MTQVTVALPASMLDQISQLSRQGYRSRNQQIVMMLGTYLAQAQAVARQAAPPLLAAESSPGYSVPQKPKE